MLGNFSTESIINYLIMIPGLLLSLSIHEFCHAYTAYKLGDKSQKYQGRLTFSPFAHIDWIGFLAISLLGFGWGKPVQVDTTNFKNPKKGLMLTSLAGPLSNLVLAVLLTIILKIMVMLNVFDVTALLSASAFSIQGVLFNMLFATISFNVVFAVFNMLPIPPFDGAKVLFYFLPYKFRNIEEFMYRYSMIIVLILLLTGLGSVIISPITDLLWKFLSMILSI